MKGQSCFPPSLQFPPSRIRRYLKQGRFSTRLTAGAPVFMAAVIEYLVSVVETLPPFAQGGQ